MAKRFDSADPLTFAGMTGSAERHPIIAFMLQAKKRPLNIKEDYPTPLGTLRESKLVRRRFPRVV